MRESAVISEMTEIRIAGTRVIESLKLLSKLVLALLASAFVGCVCLGVLTGLPDAFIATVKFYFPTAAVTALVLGMPLYFVLRLMHVSFSVVICSLLGMAVTLIPLAVLVVPEAMKPGHSPQADRLICLSTR
jgi:hypothetical protein